MPDPQLAKDRRGAHWTFDPDGYLGFVKNLRVPILPRSSPLGSVKPIIAPSFDHAVKDPDPAGVEVHPWHRIVVIEGLYCFLSIGAWKEAGEMLDERWLTTVDFEEAIERIIDRHVSSGVAGSAEVTIHPVRCSMHIAHEVYRKHNGGLKRTTCPVSLFLSLLHGGRSLNPYGKQTAGCCWTTHWNPPGSLRAFETQGSFLPRANHRCQC